MLKRILLLSLALSVLAAGVLAAPVLGETQYYSARTPLDGLDAAGLSNLGLALEAVNGSVVPYGATFSFNEVVGPRTENYGYQRSKNGRGAVVTGGGVAQAASTLYLALRELSDDIQYGDLETYGSRFTGSYVDSGDLAVITDYSAGTDFSFTNYAGDMTIEMWMTDAFAYCSITVGYDDGDDEFNWFSDSAGALPAQTAQPTARLLASAALNCGGDSSVIHNVSLAADCINDTVLATGDVFSFNQIVGPRTGEFGYIDAVNGRGAVVTGGGVAQVASAVWLSIKDLDNISIVEKSTYGSRYSQSYVASSSDAILTDYNAGTDFSFRYIGAGSITVYTRVEDGTLYCDIYAN